MEDLQTLYQSSCITPEPFGNVDFRRSLAVLVRLAKSSRNLFFAERVVLEFVASL